MLLPPYINALNLLQDVAVKVFSKQEYSDDVISSFKQEVNPLMAFNHQINVPIKDNFLYSFHSLQRACIKFTHEMIDEISFLFVSLQKLENVIFPCTDITNYSIFLYDYRFGKGSYLLAGQKDCDVASFWSLKLMVNKSRRMTVSWILIIDNMTLVLVGLAFIVFLCVRCLYKLQ